MHRTDPEGIEKRSMELIETEIGRQGRDEREKKIISRIIHATAAPELAEKIKITEDAVDSGLRALQRGVNIVTDVNMLRAGINKWKLSRLGSKVNCYITDEEVVERARREGITRSMMSMRRAVREQKNRIFAIGNAPTALFELLRLIREERAEVDLIVGTPVGFVGAAESKQELSQQALPHITLLGKKGGSAVAAAAVNALLYMMED